MAAEMTTTGQEAIEKDTSVQSGPCASGIAKLRTDVKHGTPQVL